MTNDRFKAMHPSRSDFSEIRDNARHITYDHYVNQRYPRGITVFFFDTRKVKYHGSPIDGSSYAKRKLENLLFLSHPTEKIKAEFR